MADLIGQRVGNYVIERPLKKGGMGAVYVAEHPALGKRVAVKFLDAGTDGQELSGRFLDEARITATLQHPNVVDIFDFGSLGGQFYYVMELLKGEDLGEVLAHGPLEADLAVDYLCQICLGLEAAHERGIVHRDLKPANIFLTEERPRTLKLMDFGVAKILAKDAKKTNYGQLLGTPAYMAPEQAMGDLSQISARTDLYSLGVIAYEMLSGRRPFSHEAPMMQLVAHVHEEFEPLGRSAPSLSPELCRVIEGCLQKNPLARPKSAATLAASLVRTVQGDRPRRRKAPTQEPDAVPPTQVGGRRAVPPVDDPLPATERAESLQHSTPGGPSIRIEAVDGPAPAAQAPTGDRAGSPLLIETVYEPAQVGAAQGQVAPEPTPQAAGAASQRQPNQEKFPSVALPKPVAQPLVSEVPPPVSLDDDDRNMLKKLLQRMRRKGDLPAFVATVGDVNKKADFEGKYSAAQLSDAILKDHALTAKLLRVVNTNFLNRFGGKIYSVQQAIVILGFEAVRSIALSIAVFDKAKSGPNGPRVADSSVHSLVSGEIARTLCRQVDLKDEEEATVCSMFCNLGRHLALVYLPEQFDKALERSQAEDISLDKAAEREFGISFQKLGIGVAEQWHLPPQLLEAMSASPKSNTKLRDKELRLASLAHLSNDVCELVAGGISGPEDPKLRKLLANHRNLVELEPEEVPELLGQVEESFRHRYATLLGKKARSSRFLERLPELSPRSKANREELEAQSQRAPRSVRRLALEQETKPEAGAPARTKTRGKKSVHALALGKSANDNGPALDPKDVARVKGLLDEKKDAQALERALKLLARSFQLPRLLVLRPTPDESELTVHSAIGADHDELKERLRFELNTSLQANDLLSKAYRTKKDIVVRDTYSDKVTAALPRSYYEMLGSPGLMVLPCPTKDGKTTLIVADVNEPDRLPDRATLKEFAELKKLMARASAA